MPHVKDFSVAASKLIQRANELPPGDPMRKQLLAEAKAQSRNDTFGVGHKVDKSGNPIEQGVGSAGNMTSHSIDAYIRSQQWRKGGPEPGYEMHLARMKRELAECQARRAREAKDELE